MGDNSLVEQRSSRVRLSQQEVVAALDRMIHRYEQTPDGETKLRPGPPEPDFEPSELPGPPSKKRVVPGRNRTPSGTQSNLPATDSAAAQAKAAGNIAGEKVDSNAGWGNLPAKEQAKALQDVSRSYPSYYREVVQEFFRLRATKSEKD